MVKNLHASAGDTRDKGFIPELGKSLGVGDDNPLQYSCLENSKDRGAWWAEIHGVTKSQTLLSTQTPTLSTMNCQTDNIHTITKRAMAPGLAYSCFQSICWLCLLYISACKTSGYTSQYTSQYLLSSCCQFSCEVGVALQKEALNDKILRNVSC